MSKKLEEKQQRRLAEEQREREKKRAALRRNLVTFGVVGLVGLLVVALIFFERQGSSGPVGVAAEEAGCTEIQTHEIEGGQHLPDGTPVQYETNPPSSGDHWQQPAAAGFFPVDQNPPPPERVVHNLEHGQIAIWYNPGAPTNVVDDVQNLIRGQRGGQALALLGVPYPELESGYNIGISAWGAMQLCASVSSDVIDEFRAQFQGRGPEDVGVPPFDPDDAG